MTLARPILVLCRISNLPTILANVLAAWFLAGGAWDLRLAAAFLAGALCYSGGMILNDVFDVDWDRRHGKPRPIPAGQIEVRTAAVLGWSGLALGWLILLLLGANPAWTTALAAAIVSYNALHKRWTGSFGLMGACRFFLFVSVASIPDSSPPGAVWLWAAALAVYVAGITLAARHEDTGGSMPPAALACLLLPVACALLFTPALPGPRLAFALLLLLVFLAWVLLAHRRLRAGKIHLGAFVGQLLAGMVLVDAMAVSPAQPLAALLCLLLLPLNLFLQALVPAT